MGEETGSGIGTMPIASEIWVTRHGQKKFGSANPSLTERGQMQAMEMAQKYLTEIKFDAIYRGAQARHVETAEIVKVTLRLSCDILETPALSLTHHMNDDANECAIKGRNHPDGPAVGFRVDTWLEADSILMDNCFEQFQNFLRGIPRKMNTVLAISSSPIVESATTDPENTQLLGECGIIKYIIDGKGLILSSEVIFEGFFEKPPQEST